MLCLVRVRTGPNDVADCRCLFLGVAGRLCGSDSKAGGPGWSVWRSVTVGGSVLMSSREHTVCIG